MGYACAIQFYGSIVAVESGRSFIRVAFVFSFSLGKRDFKNRISLRGLERTIKRDFPGNGVGALQAVYRVPDRCRRVPRAPPAYAATRLVPDAGGSRDIRYGQTRGNHFSDSPCPGVCLGVDMYFGCRPADVANRAGVGKCPLFCADCPVGIDDGYIHPAGTMGGQGAGHMM
ncbi:MAG: hypothetical protein BWX80_02442 [Candidatus Hydrogenedentes bacterium ADurb.Bin101]|nr:MAG: hypothetical protein BWX80_02442 [Candidatus Hydrogenedentes bacterium ADurb.Bin101]